MNIEYTVGTNRGICKKRPKEPPKIYFLCKQKSIQCLCYTDTPDIPKLEPGHAFPKGLHSRRSKSFNNYYLLMAHKPHHIQDLEPRSFVASKYSLL